MECPNCAFQNIPGTRVCVRCRSLLDLDAVDFVPPRAAAGRAGRHVRGAANVVRFSATRTWSDVRRSLRLPAEIRVTWSEVAWSIIPGGAQIRSPLRGMRALGWGIFGLWLAIVLLALVNVGSGFGSVLAYAAVSVHCFGISLVFAAALQGQRLQTRLAIGILLYVAVLFLLYWPAWTALGNTGAVLPVSGLRSHAVVDNGDVLLYTGRWLRPASWSRGDLVVTGIDGSSASGVMVAPGFNVDRILGLPGDEVHIESGKVLVNGDAVPPELGPIGGTRGLPTMDLVAAPNTYIVLPSALRLGGGHGNITALTDGLFRQTACVPEDHLLGRVVLRVRPWSRFGWPRSPAAPTPSASPAVTALPSSAINPTSP